MRFKARWACMALGSFLLVAPVAVPADDTFDPRVDAVLEEVAAAYQKAQTLTADLVETTGSTSEGMFDPAMTDRYSGTVCLKKPNLARVNLLRGSRTPGTILASDGKMVWFYFKALNKYDTWPVSPKGSIIPFEGPLQTFFQPRAFFGHLIPHKDLHVEDRRITRYLGTQKTEDGECRVVEFRQEGGDYAYAYMFYVRKDGLIARYIHDDIVDHQRQDLVFKHIRVNISMADSEFAYTPPKDAQRAQ